ncbi:peptidase S8/S53 domain-containing protein [Trichoderma sp. SZMC 28015]
MDSLVDTIEASEADGLPEEERIKRTKVAVIDTGICWNNPFINGARHRIKETRNWIPNNSGLVDSFDVEDKVGHGTQTTELLLAVAPGVEVCIARVSEDGLLDNENYIAEADIVSMSFGLEDRSDVVLDAILAAYKEKKILLAAASNGGGNDGIAFPANQREVICVFATDGKGNPSPFNPTFTPEMDDGSYFSTLGEAVEVHQLSELGRAACAKICKSGTSFATPIAAGIVANLLDYAKAKKNIGEENLRRLHSFSGMISVLKLLAPKKRGGHNYICPWMLWEDKSAKTRERYADIIRSKILIQLNS